MHTHSCPFLFIPEELNLSKNDIGGSIPSEMGLLMAMRDGMVGRTREGTVISNTIVGIDSLMLTNMDLIGSTPTELSALSELGKLLLCINWNGWVPCT